MTTEAKTVNITPTWKAAAHIYIMALESGTEEGKRAAREGIMEMAEHLDNHNAKAREANAEPEAPAKVTCGNCGRSWDENKDPAPSALCHYCHGRGHSTAPLFDTAAIAKAAKSAATKLHREEAANARKVNCRLYSRGFEFLSLDEKGERDENVIDYCDRDEMTAELVAKFIDDVRKAGSAFLAIGYGVDAAASKADYEAGDYEPMFEWVDLPDIDVR